MLDYTGAVQGAGVEEEIGGKIDAALLAFLSYAMRGGEGPACPSRVSSERANIQQAFILDTALNGSAEH